ncbi:MAG: preprotein translocase subunit SecA [Phycisphaerales bacterium]|nr:preprotein translocase subunit SecA [Phycisphaerales bacterium]
MAIPVVSKVGKKIFGTRNDRMVKRYLQIVDKVTAFDADMRQLTDSELLAKTNEFKQRTEEGATTEQLIPEVFAVAREAMDRGVGIRNIFNPAHEFDPNRLPAEARALYDQVKAEIDASEPRPPSEELLGNLQPVDPWVWVEIPPALYEAVRVLEPNSRPPFRARPFDVQIIGAMVLFEGRIAEMKTGEGKTIVAPLACYLAAISGEQVHVVTVNDYLVQRDRDWTFPFFRQIGLRVGAIHPQHMQPLQVKQIMYQCDVVYGTTSEFGFDYLRDNMKLSAQEQVQKRRDRAIVDEVDSTLIDEARTPLIISGPAHEHTPRYEMADKLGIHLLKEQEPWTAADQKVQSCLVEISGIEGDIRNAREKDSVGSLKDRLQAAKSRLPELEDSRDRYSQYFEIELDKKRATLTHEGISEAQRVAGVGSFYVGDNIDLPHLLEQSIRAQTVYQRDRDYIVAPDDKGEMSVIIVDQNTGRKMIGRQWSDGLHQAIEAKESVPIKQETQTMATITIQNFFKLYDSLSGMTGTADTEATEFYEIYSLDVVVIPTNVPVIRGDHEDVVYLNVKDKSQAVLEEIKSFHDVGRPILVGTTSVEKSKELSDGLTKDFGIKHEVLNAEQHDRESEIIKYAGNLGAVMIATNMAGRGTDIKLGQFQPADLIEHWKQRGICPRDVTAELDEDEIIRRVYRHMAPGELGLKKSEVAEMSDDQLRRRLLEHWYVSHCWGKESKASSMSEKAILAALDESDTCMYHDLCLYRNVEDLGGLHVIATERHESRRIDNQLRGRSGRQGDKGSTRFFLSLEDDLMKMFAGPTTLKVLSKLGMKEGDAIEHPMLSRAVGRAQRKVEERNFLIRKNILEYDEVMDHQRHSFYGMRQNVLEGIGIKDLIFEHLDNAIDDATWRFLDGSYVGNCIAEWTREHMGVGINPDRTKGKDRVDLHEAIRNDAKGEATNIIEVTLGEFLSDDIDLGKGKVVERDAHGDDFDGLSNWARSHFGTDLKISVLQDMTRDQIVDALKEAADAKIDSTDLDELDPFLVENYTKHELATWVSSKFDIECTDEEFAELGTPEIVSEYLHERARDLYRQRECRYPVDFVLDLTTNVMQQDPRKALTQFTNWARYRYELDWDPEKLPSSNPMVLRDILYAEAEKWDETKIRERVQRVMAATTDRESFDAWCTEHVGVSMPAHFDEGYETDREETIFEFLTEVLRVEMLQFERWILLQIVDGAWKDHLHSMDQLREAIGYRSFSQLDPRIEYKREGSKLFEDMHEEIRDRVTDLIFKARLQPQVAQRPQGQAATPQQPKPSGAPAQPGTPPAAAAAAAAAAGTPGQRRDIETAQQTTGGGTPPPARKRQPASGTATVGRNEPCPCGSGKKYKKCCATK